MNAFFHVCADVFVNKPTRIFVVNSRAYAILCSTRNLIKEKKVAMIPRCALIVLHLSNVWGDFFSYFCFFYVCSEGGICLHECRYPLSLEEGISSPGVRGGCGLPITGVGNKTHIFC